MALIFFGSTKCDLCGLTLNEGEEIVSFPAIIQNRADPLYKFNDQAFHLNCLTKHHQWNNIQRVLDLFRKYGMSKKCIVCDQSITSPDDYLNTGLLTWDKRNSLFKYNFLEFHKQHFAAWEERFSLWENLKKQKIDMLWVGDSLDLFF